MVLATLLLAATLFQTDSAVAFVDVNVVPMNRDGVVEHQTVIVRGNRIAQMGPAAQIKAPRGARTINGHGKYLMPGLGDMHGGLPSPDAPPELIENVLFLYLANGVTTVRGMQGTVPSLELKARIARGGLLGPHLWVSGPALTAATPDVARRLVEEQHAAGFDQLRIQEGVSRDTYDTIAATARRLGMRFAGPVPDNVGIYHVLASGQASIEHLDNYVETVSSPDSTDARIARVVTATCKAHVWTVPTLSAWETLLGVEDSASLAGREELRYMPAAWRQAWARELSQAREQHEQQEQRLVTLAMRRRILKALQTAGCPVAIGTDSPGPYSVPGFSIVREMQSMAAAGLTPQQILLDGTRQVARYFGAEHEFGTVAPGQRADLLLLNGNPLTDLANVSRHVGVMISGRWITEADIRARLERIATSYQ
jgi:imidazolonepropionase-like amidohydrolase